MKETREAVEQRLRRKFKRLWGHEPKATDFTLLAMVSAQASTAGIDAVSDPSAPGSRSSNDSRANSSYVGRISASHSVVLAGCRMPAKTP